MSREHVGATNSRSVHTRRHVAETCSSLVAATKLQQVHTYENEAEARHSTCSRDMFLRHAPRVGRPLANLTRRRPQR